MHGAGVKKQGHRGEEDCGGEAEGEGVPDDLESVGQDVIMDRRDHHRGEGDEKELNRETLSQKQQHRADQPPPNRDGPGRGQGDRRVISA